MRKWMFLVATATSVSTGMQAEAQGLRGIAPTTKQGEKDKEAKPAAAENTSDIVVTATRRAQRLSNVPIALSAYGTSALARSGATDIRQTAQLAPSLSVTSTGSEANATARLRGIGTVGENPGLESSVAVFIDGVYRSRTGSGLNDLGEVERIEVLRGPQGTLSGRNSSAGAISIYTKYPSFTPGGYGEASYGNYNAVRLAGGLTGPVIKDVLAFRLDGVVGKRDGYYYDVANKTDYNNRNRYFGRGQLFFKPTPNLSLRLIGDYTYRNEKCCGAVDMDTREKIDPTPGVPGDFAYSPQNRIVAMMKGLGAMLPSEGNPYNRQIALTPGRAYANVVKDYGLSSRIGWLVGKLQLISISAYREYKAGDAGDPEYSNLDLAYRADDGKAYRRFRTYTHETRLSGGLFDNRLDWMVGGYFAHERLEVSDNLKFGSQFGTFAACSSILRLNPNAALRDPTAKGCLSDVGRTALTTALGPQLVEGFDRLGDANNIGTVRDLFAQTSTNYAFFTHNIFRLTDTLSLTGGLRYTHEHKQIAAALNSTNNVCPTQMATLGSYLDDASAARRGAAAMLIGYPCAGNSSSALNGVPLKDSFSEGQFTGTTVLSWQATPATLLYGSYARGYKAGGYNLARAGLIPGSFKAADLRFDPETVQAYELGVKYSTERFSANLAGFRSTFSNFQLNTFNGVAFVVQNVGGCANALNGADRDESATTGACTGKVGPGVVTQGLELEAGAYPTPDVTFNLGYTYAHTQYRDDLVGSAAGAPLSPSLFMLPGRQMSNAPRHVLTGSATWTPAIGHHGLTGLVYVDGRLTSDYNTGSDLFAEKIQDGYALVNARIGLRGRNQRWAVELWGQNVFDTDYEQIAGAAYLQGSGSQSQVQRFGAPRYAVGTVLTHAFLAEPRTYGVTLRSRF